MIKNACRALLFLTTFSCFALAHAESLSIQDRLGVLAKHPFSTLDKVSEDQQNLYRHLISAAMVMDEIYLDQVHPHNRTWLAALEDLKKKSDTTAPFILEYFQASHGPWDIFNPQQWIIPAGFFPKNVPGQMLKLDGYNVYPTVEKNGVLQSVDVAELDAWLKAHPSDEKAFKSPFTVIRRGKNGQGFVAIPYSVYYKKDLSRAATYLEKAAKFAHEPLVKKLLLSRALAFRTNQFSENEVDWVNTHDSEVQVLIGPYEESVDDIWGVKRGFGAQIGFKDKPYTEALQTYKSLGEKFQDHLPIPAKYHPDRLKEPFFTVWNQVYSSGDSRQGTLPIAQKLTNDREFTIKHGARQLFFRDSQDGKCEKILLPLAKLVMTQADLPFVTCDSFFKASLHHEYAHALGVSFWYPDWNKPDPASRKEVNDNLPKWGGRLEELKADALGLYNRQYMLDQKLEPAEKDRDLVRELYATMVAGFLRSVQFGLTKSYALNAMIMLNHMIDAGAVKFDPKQEGRLIMVAKKMPKVLEQNARDALMLQVANDDAAVGEFYKKWAVIRPETQALLDRLNAAKIPRDLYPTYPILTTLNID